MEEYFPSDRLLSLTIGSVVQITREDVNQSFSVNLVGVDNEKFIITTLPAKQQLEQGYDYDACFAEGAMFEMKTIYDGRVVAFESSVIGRYEDRLLIGSFPEMVETRRLRRDIRFPCTMACDIRLGKNEAYGAITDISNGGCQLSVKKNQEYGFIEEALNSQESLELEIFFPFSEHPAILSAKVKSSVCEIDGACKVGLAFNQEYESVRQYLESLQLDSVAPFFF